jgi:hypothetical protein
VKHRLRSCELRLVIDARTSTASAPGATTLGRAQLRSAPIRARTGSAFARAGRTCSRQREHCLSTTEGGAPSAAVSAFSPSVASGFSADLADRLASRLLEQSEVRGLDGQRGHPDDHVSQRPEEDAVPAGSLADLGPERARFT